MDIASLHAWMESFAKAVRDRKTDDGEKLFKENVIGFGTRVAVAKGRDSLIENQWAPVWNATRNFDFECNNAIIRVHGNIAWIATTWSSEFDKAGQLEVGKKRFGRCTIILCEYEDGLKAIHTHFSLWPDGQFNK